MPVSPTMTQTKVPGRALGLRITCRASKYAMLVTIDYPDALTAGLRRTTDSTRGIVEKTRGDLTLALRQEALREALRATELRLADAESSR